MNASRVVNLCMKVNRYNSCEIAAKRIVIFNEISIMILLSSYVLLDKTVEWSIVLLGCRRARSMNFHKMSLSTMWYIGILTQQLTPLLTVHVLLQRVKLT